MYVSESWLRELVDPSLNTQQLADQLTMAGLEVGGIEPAAPPFSGVVIGTVLTCERHPDAEKLSVCTVDIGTDEPSIIVCGAPNVRASLTVAVATVGARLPGGMKIRKAKLRGVVSQGMICSTRELGLGDEHDGIMELPSLEVGRDFRELFQLDDNVIELDLTPNRGDCLGMHGVAREVAALNGQAFSALEVPPVPAVNDEKIAVHLDAPEHCARYAGRVVRNINPVATTPLWMIERLRRAGLRAIHPVVDITNYVMIEMGKPIHAFDLSTMRGDVRVRLALAGEQITLLDGRELTLNDQVLGITDDSGVRALAGIMGGENSGVSEQTTDVFFESAYFDQTNIAGKARNFGLHTDASHRFERGVDPDLCGPSLERATELLLQICGGEPGPLVIEENSAQLPVPRVVDLAHAHLERLIGRTYERDQVTAILKNLGLTVEVTEDGWRAGVPGDRFDLAIPEDLIEEVARIVGYDTVGEHRAVAKITMPPVSEQQVPEQKLRELLIARGYHEAITYTFVDPRSQQVLSPDITPLKLRNPISADLSVMRTSLLPGLAAVVHNNQRRQKPRVRLFETGLRFILQDDEIKQENAIGILASGELYSEQWGLENRPINWFDLANDVTALLAIGGPQRALRFEPAEYPELHPGQSARVLLENVDIGRIGALHPRITAELELEGPIMYSELLLDAVCEATVPRFAAISKYPEVRRDLALIVAETVSVGDIVATIKAASPALLKAVRVFDVYRGKGIEAGAKSIALGLILQESSRTLTDVDVDSVIDEVTARLQQNLQAKIRD